MALLAMTSATDTDVGKAVQVTSMNVIHEGEPVIEVTSSFLYHGRFTNDKTFSKIIQEPNYEVRGIPNRRLNRCSLEGVV